jgi:putative peptidoglycan lipid II flippase
LTDFLSFLRTESYKSGIALSIGFSLLAKLIAFASSLVLAALFGTSGEMDVYLYSLFVATLVTSFISALNSSVIIPESMRLAGQSGERQSQELVNFFLYAYAAAGLGIAAVFIPAPAEVFGVISRFDTGVLAGNERLLYSSLPLFPLILVSTLLADVLASRKYFTVPILASMANNVFVLFCVLAFHGRLGVFSALLGLCFAYAAQSVLLLFMLRRRLGWEFGLPSRLPSRKVLGNSLFAQLGQLATAVSAYVPMFLLSGLDRGTVSAMNYGRQAAEFPNNFITQQFSAVAGIKLNELFANKQPGEVDRVVVASLKGLSFVLVPAALFGAFYSREIIGALFGRGAFGPESVESASGFFRLFALLLPLYAANSIVARLFLSAQKVREVFWYQIAMNLLLAGLIVLFVDRFGALGYPSALLAFYTFSLFSAGFLCAHYFPDVGYWNGVRYLGRITAINAVILLFVAEASGRLLPASPMAAAVLGAIFYFGVLAWISLRLGINEDFKRVWTGLKGKITGSIGK